MQLIYANVRRQCILCTSLIYSWFITPAESKEEKEHSSSRTMMMMMSSTMLGCDSRNLSTGFPGIVWLRVLQTIEICSSTRGHNIDTQLRPLSSGTETNS